MLAAQFDFLNNNSRNRVFIVSVLQSYSGQNLHILNILNTAPSTAFEPEPAYSPGPVNILH